MPWEASSYMLKQMASSARKTGRKISQYTDVRKGQLAVDKKTRNFLAQARNSGSSESNK